MMRADQLLQKAHEYADLGMSIIPSPQEGRGGSMEAVPRGTPDKR